MNFNKKSVNFLAVFLMLWLAPNVNASPFLWADDFEDGDLGSWQGGVIQVFSPGADASQFAMNMRSGKAEASLGAYVRPTEFSFYFRSHSVATTTGIRLLGDGPSYLMTLVVRRDKVSMLGTLWSVTVDPLVWHKLAITHIDWQTKQFDIKIDDQVVAENMPFNGSFADGFVKTILFEGSRLLIDNVELVGELATDIEKPAITLLTPTPESTVFNPVLISGHADDAGGLARVGLTLFVVNQLTPVAFGEQNFSGDLTSPWQFEFNNLSPQNYRVELKGEDLAGNSVKLISTFVVSEGNGNPDTTPASTPIVTDSGETTTDLAVLSVSVDTADAESGVTALEYSVGTVAFENDVRDWTQVAYSQNVVISDLNLQKEKTYYINVRAINGANLVSAIGSSDGIKVIKAVDVTPPSTPIVEDDGDVIQATGVLHAAWNSTDLESDIVEYRYAIGTEPFARNILEWTSAGGLTDVIHTGLELTRGLTYYISVVAINADGLLSEVGTSDGISVVQPEQVDTTAPSIEVSSPQNNAVISLNNATLQVTGTATDERELKRVVVVLSKIKIVNGREFPKVISTKDAELLQASNWKAEFQVTEIGKYNIHARAFDASDNKSDIIKRNFEIVVIE
jgi:Bacterial Ig domain